MPKYAALIYANEASLPAQNSPDRQMMFQSYMTFSDEASQAGVMKGGDGLQPTLTATTVRVRDGQTLTTDGPFAETKEQLGGFFIFDCKNLDEAIHWAAKIPGAKHGCIEVRPTIEM